MRELAQITLFVITSMILIASLDIYINSQTMPYIYYNKQQDNFKLFGSLPVMCKASKLDYKKMQYAFREDKTEYNDDNVRIIKINLERGGKR